MFLGKFQLKGEDVQKGSISKAQAQLCPVNKRQSLNIKYTESESKMGGKSYNMKTGRMKRLRYPPSVNSLVCVGKGGIIIRPNSQNFCDLTVLKKWLDIFIVGL